MSIRLKNRRRIYVSVTIISAAVLLLGIFVLNFSRLAGTIIIAFSMYLFFGSIIKLCRSSAAYRDAVKGMPDLLFWLP